MARAGHRARGEKKLMAKGKTLPVCIASPPAPARPPRAPAHSASLSPQTHPQAPPHHPRWVPGASGAPPGTTTMTSGREEEQATGRAPAGLRGTTAAAAAAATPARRAGPVTTVDGKRMRMRRGGAVWREESGVTDADRRRRWRGHSFSPASSGRPRARAAAGGLFPPRAATLLPLCGPPRLRSCK